MRCCSRNGNTLMPWRSRRSASAPRLLNTHTNMSVGVPSVMCGCMCWSALCKLSKAHIPNPTFDEVVMKILQWLFKNRTVFPRRLGHVFLVWKGMGHGFQEVGYLISHFLCLSCGSILSSAEHEDTSLKRRLAALLRCMRYSLLLCLTE